MLGFLRKAPTRSHLTKVSILAAAAIASAGIAFEARADGTPVSLKDTAPPPPEEYVWDGLYVGVGVGGASFDHDLDVTATKSSWWSTHESEKSFSDDDWHVFRTVQVGYDRTINKRFLIGAFADFDFFPNTDEKFSSKLFDNCWNYLGHLDGSLDLKDVWNVGGRAGFLITPRVLLYAVGGYSHADLDGSVDVKFKHLKYPLSVDINDMDGYFVGGGAEIKIQRNVSLKFEYRYTNLGSQSGSDDACHKGKYYTETADLDAQMQSVRANLILKFGEPEHPVEALK
jgi:opacity protein-like surface antigen